LGQMGLGFPVVICRRRWAFGVSWLSIYGGIGEASPFCLAASSFRLGPGYPEFSEVFIHFLMCLEAQDSD
jgi:hypothetical protein